MIINIFFIKKSLNEPLINFVRYLTRIERNWLCTTVLYLQLDMILQITTDTWRMLHELNVVTS